MQDRTRKLFAYAGTGFFAAMLILAFAPAGSSVTHGDACAVPGTANVVMSRTVSYGLLRPLDPDSSQEFEIRYRSSYGFSITDIPVTITLGTTADWLTVSPTSFTRTIPASDDDTGFDEPLTFRPEVMVNRDAPFRERAEVTVNVQVAEGTCVNPVPDTALEGAAVTAGFYENYDVELQGAAARAGQNDAIIIPMVVTNAGNGDIRLTVDLHERSSGALRMPLPPPFTVRNAAVHGDNNQATVELEINTPFKNGYEHRLDDLILIVAGTPVDDTTLELTPYTVSAMIQTRGVYVPGFDAALMLLALLGAAFIVKTRR